MILELVEKTYQTHDTIAIIDIITDDDTNATNATNATMSLNNTSLNNTSEAGCEHIDAQLYSKVIIQAPVHKYLDGVYKIWKYTDYGYAWIKHTANSSISYVLFYDNSNASHLKIPVRHISDRYIFIYCLNPVRSSSQLELTARCEIMMTSTGEVHKWYVQDQDTLQWMHTKNIKHSLC